MPAGLCNQERSAIIGLSVVDWFIPMSLSHSPDVLPIPAFADNYLWLIHDGSHAAVVDPGDAAPVLETLKARGLKLVAILLTHHHADHVGGVPDLLAQNAVPVFGPRGSRIGGITIPLSEGDAAVVPELGLRFSVLEVPGHTLDHIAYHEPDRRWLFCGDTLFAAGCGRLFEGSPAQMTESLAKLTALPDDTAVYCAHEYTMSNLKFAREVEPENMALLARISEEQQKRDQNRPTLPSFIGLEKSTNPFLRYTEPRILDRLATLGRLPVREAIPAFAALREWKNSYR
jgi:hydroxyacylglutathione hydrolase